ncbi:hypothetical protein N431DRAFT_441111 [Stipitochalara longipes BDJ]|nr:hypothetical protein N431DRAFT_441111 [Stipitochalara longipes BDJ]
MFMRLNTYVIEELDSLRCKPLERDGEPLLHIYFRFCRTRRPSPSPEVLNSILAHRAKPNEEYDGSTSWQDALDKPVVDRATLIAMLNFGANPNERRSDGSSPLVEIAKRIGWELQHIPNRRFSSLDEIPRIRGYLEIIRSFIEHGADLGPEDMRNILEELDMHLEFKLELENTILKFQVARQKYIKQELKTKTLEKKILELQVAGEEEPSSKQKRRKQGSSSSSKKRKR